MTSGPAAPQGNRRLGYGLLFASLMLGAAAPPFYRLADHLPPIQLAFLVSLCGTACSGILLAVRPGRDPFKVYLRDRGQLVLLVSWAIGSFTVLVLALSAGTHTLSASLTALVYRTWPLMLGLLAWPILGERLRPRQWAGLGIGFLGIVAAYAWSGNLLFPARDAPLVGFLFVGALADAIAAAYSKRYRPANMLSFVFLCNLIALGCFTVLGGGTGLLHGEPLSTPELVAVLFLGGPQNVGLTILFVYSYGLVEETAPVALVYLASPFVTFGLDAIFLHEPILPEYWLVAGGVVAGALVMRSARPWKGRSASVSRPPVGPGPVA
ncbi:MAG: DMT family transporter [Thermoplasmata archaeon]